MAQFAFPVSIIFVTSLLLYAATRDQGKSRQDIFVQSFRALLECIGAFAFFLAVNLLLGLAIILIIRSSTHWFMTVYDLENPVLVVLSAAQGFIFQRWWTVS